MLYVPRLVKLSDDTNIAVLTKRFERSVRNFDRQEQIRVFKRIYRVLDSSAPHREVEKAYQDCEELQQLREGNYIRMYCRLVRNPPNYNILYVFEVDKHQGRNLQKFDESAKQAVREIEQRTTTEGVEDYLEEHNTFNSEDIGEILDRLQGE